MKLGATITSERGKPVTKTGNEFINVAFNYEKKQRLLVTIQYKNGNYELWVKHENEPIKMIAIEKENGNLKHGKKLNEIYPDIFPNK
jgi:hypothetical protein